MAEDSPPSKRTKTDFNETYEVNVGTGSGQQRFVVYSSILCRASRLFAAVRRDRWTKGIGVDPAKPIELPDEDPGVFNRLQDLLTADLVIDYIINFTNVTKAIPDLNVVAVFYTSTVAGTPLRRLMMGFWVHGGCANPRYPLHAALPGAMEAMLTFYSELIGSKLFGQHTAIGAKCHYHQHDKDHPACGPQEET